jgi:predicted DNA-binding protein (MmcQ/YjbR family)
VHGNDEGRADERRQYMVGTVPGRSVAVHVPRVAGQEPVERVDEVRLGTGAEFDERDAGGGVRHEDIEQSVAPLGAETLDIAGEVGELASAHVDAQLDRVHGRGIISEMASNMERLERIVGTLPEAVRVDIEAWGDEPTFRVRGKNFIFCDPQVTGVTVKLPKDEAAAVVATDSKAEPCGYGLGRHGWVSVTIGARPSAARWKQIEEWVRTSYCLVAPRALARLVDPGS